MSEAEDVVQEVLLAVHLKRGTWDPARPIGPWLSTIVRKKMIDSLRRRGRRVNVAIEEVIDTPEAERPNDGFDRLDASIAAALEASAAGYRSFHRAAGNGYPRDRREAENDRRCCACRPAPGPEIPGGVVQE